MVVRRAAKHIETTSTSAMTFFTDGRRGRWPKPAATPNRPEWISCRYSCLCCYRCCRCTFFTINSRNQTIQVANTENANVNWKICATIEHKEQQAAGREGATVGQGSCIHTCKHVCVCVRWELKRFDLCAKNYASTATWTSCKTMGKGAGCRQEAGRGRSPEEGHAVAGAAYDAIKTSNANIEKANQRHWNALLCSCNAIGYVLISIDPLFSLNKYR